MDPVAETTIPMRASARSAFGTVPDVAERAAHSARRSWRH